MIKKIALISLIVLAVVFTGCRKNKNTAAAEEKVPEINPAEYNENEEIYDAVVVGGGLAGLGAAYKLKTELGEEAKILLLEKENRLGGRVWTKKFGEYYYELGATFAYSPTLVPKNFELPELVVSPDLYGEYRNGKMTSSRKMFQRDSSFTGNSNMLGNGKQYGKYEYLSHRAGGNGKMIEAWEKELTGKFILEAEVVSVKNEGKNVAVSYKKGGKEEIVKAKTVIVATPATVADKIIKNMKEESANFLKSVSYNSRMVVNLLARLDKPVKFASINSDFLLLYVTNYGNGVYSLYCYIWDASEKAAYVDLSKQWLKETGILNEKSEILHIDSYFWKEELTLVSDKTYGNFSEAVLNPLPGVFLAGDYTFWNELKLPYGMPPAYFSGKTAAKKVVEYLKK